VKRKLRLMARLKSFYKHDGRCYYCGQRMFVDEFTIDHLYPVSKGGSDHPDNLVPACLPCNTLKGDTPIHLFKLKYFKNYKLYYEEVRL
jgi:5-methylcytosine-specific restriction endonuclease McrA